MKQADWNHRILNEIDPELVESAAAPAKKRTVRPVRIAVIAACLCGLLVGGAFAAAEILELIPVQSYTREDGKVVSWYQTEKNTHTVPLDCLSEEALAFAASQMSLPATRVCESWDEAEEFLGLEVADISAPHGLAPTEMRVQLGGRSEVTYHCAVSFVGRCDAPTFVELRAAYDLDGVRISVKARISTENSRVEPGNATHYFMADSSMKVTGWVTPSGVTAMAVAHPVGGLYTGYFILNDISFEFTASGTESPDQTLSALMELMDSFK